MIELLLERGSHAYSDFIKIEEQFIKLKKTKTNKDFVEVFKETEKLVTKLLKTKTKFYLDIDGELKFNFAIIPILEGSKELRKGEDFVHLVNVKEMHLIMGFDLFKHLDARELTAVFCHEIGHVVNHLGKTASLLNTYSQTFNKVFLYLYPLPIVGLLLLPLYIISSRTYSFTNHMGEYNADKFVVECGYGDDLIRVFSKFHSSEKITNQSMNRFLYYIMMMKTFILGKSHPDTEKRIKAVVNQIKSDYSKEYHSPFIKKILDMYY